MGLLAVIGPSRKLQRGPSAFCARRRAKVRALPPQVEHLVLLGDEIGLRADRTEHRASADRRLRREWSKTAFGRSEYPTRDAATAGGTAANALGVFAAAFLSLLFPGLGHAYAGAWLARPRPSRPFRSCCIALLGGIVLRDEPARAAGLPAPARDPERDPRPQRPRPRLPDRRRDRRLAGRELPQPRSRRATAAMGGARRDDHCVRRRWPDCWRCSWS